MGAVEMNPLAQLSPTAAPLLLATVGAFIWLLAQTVSPRRIGWLSSVLLPSALAIGSGFTLFPQAKALLTGATGGSWFIRFGAIAAAWIAGMLFDQSSSLRSAKELGERLGQRKSGPLLLWGMAATLLCIASLKRQSPQLAATFESYGSLLGSASVFALLGQASSWVLRLGNAGSNGAKPASAKAAPPSPDPAQLRRGSFFGGGLAAGVSIVLIWWGTKGMGSSGAVAPPGALAVGSGGPLKNSAIYLLLKDSSSPRTLSPEGANPRWSPDGARLAFTRADPSEIWVAAPDGSDARRIYRIAGIIMSLAWSHDRQQIYFGHADGFFAGDLRVISAEGGSTQTLLPASEGVECPDVSPDGRHLAYYRSLDTTQVSQPPRALKLLDLTTRQTQTLVSDTAAKLNVMGLAWTRDGRALLVSCADERGQQCWLERVEIASPRRQRLADAPGYMLTALSRQAGADDIAAVASPRLPNGNLDEKRDSEIWLINPASGRHSVVVARFSTRPFQLHASPTGSVHGGAIGIPTTTDQLPVNDSDNRGDSRSLPPPPPLGGGPSRSR